MYNFLDLVDPAINNSKYSSMDLYFIVGGLALLVILFGTLAVVKQKTKN